MTKFFTACISAGLLMTSCGKQESSSVPDFNAPPASAPEKVQETVPVDPSARIAEGKSLIEGTDCLTCHKTDDKLIGPSYREIAGRYDNNPQNLELLAGKIIDGGSGVWGSVPMSAHPGMSRDNAKKMVEYILSLRVN
ncbi:c-type cytochrome [Marnyiella aurantia]|nr:c-type cytochrome [Marnyiella aurantia]